MEKENSHNYRLPADKRYMLKIINRLAIGIIIILWGGLLALKQVGIIAENVSTWPFVFIAVGIVLIIGAIYRFHARQRA